MAALFPSYVITVLELFRKHGFEAYVVGGAVRDLLCGKHPHDYDIVTSARPEETRRLCKGAGGKPGRKFRCPGPSCRRTSR